MNGKNSLVCDYMKLSSVFVYEKDTIFDAFQTMKKLNVDRISIVKENFSIVGILDNRKIKEILENEINKKTGNSKELQIKDVIKNKDLPIILYPKMKITSAYLIMKGLNIDCLPVVNTPWDKKIIGFLWMNDILPGIEKGYTKIPV